MSKLIWGWFGVATDRDGPDALRGLVVRAEPPSKWRLSRLSLRGISGRGLGSFTHAQLGCVVGVILLMLAWGCRSSGPGRHQSSSASSRIVEPPAGLLASFSVRSPRAFYEALRNGASEGAWYLPATYPVLVGQILGLGPSEAGAIDEIRPAAGVLVKRNADPALVLAIPLRTPTSLKATLTSGANAPYRGVPSTSGILHLVAQGPTASATRTLKLALFDGHLIVGQGFAAIDAAGPFLTRSVLTDIGTGATELDPASLHLSASGKAFGQSLAALTRARWSEYQRLLLEEADEERQRRGDRPPDFADPAAVILSMSTAVDELASLFEGMESFELLVDVIGRGLRIRAGLGAPAVAQTAPLDVQSWLGAVPATSSLAFVHSLDPARRSQAAREFASALQRLFGPRLSAESSSQIRQALEDTSNVLPKTVGFGVLANNADRCGFLSAQPVRQKEFVQALDRVTALSTLPAFSEPIATQLGKFSLRSNLAWIPGDPAIPIPSLRVGWFPDARSKTAAKGAKGSRSRQAVLQLWAGAKRGTLSLGTPLASSAAPPSGEAPQSSARPPERSVPVPVGSAGVAPAAEGLEVGVAVLAPDPSLCWRELSRNSRSLGELPEVAALLEAAPREVRWLVVLRSEVNADADTNQLRFRYAAASLAKPSELGTQLYLVLPTEWMKLVAP